MARLYDLTEAFCELLARLEDCTSEEQVIETMNLLGDLQTDIAEKADGCARMMRNLQAEAEALEGEIARLTAKKRAAENGVKRIKNYVHISLETAGATKLETTIGTWRIQKNPPSVVVKDLASIPARFLIPLDPDVNKRAMLEAYKATGEIFPGVEFVQKEGVRFR